MKAKLIVTLSLFLALCNSSQAQFRCGFDEIRSRQIKTDPSYRKRVLDTERNIQKYIQRNRQRLSAKTSGTAAALYTIPVVVHVIHTGGAPGTPYNPSDATIQGAINYLNQVFNGTGMEGVGDMQIQFALAVRDPSCNATNGINRVDGSSLLGYDTYGIQYSQTNGPTELQLKNLSRWDPTDYYNIWVVNKIDSKDGTSGTFVGGYAYPVPAPADRDGTVMLATQMAANKKTLPHEIGHAFGLYHPFDDDNPTGCAANTDCTSQGDYVCDTDPIVMPPDYITCRTGTNPCTNTAYSTNTERNFMNYTNCYTLFTAGQKARALAVAGSIYRASLSTSGALTPVNTVYPYVAPVAACTPVTGATGLGNHYAGITNFEINNKVFPSFSAATDGGYRNLTPVCIKTISLTRGNSYNLSISVLDVNTHNIRAWIDYNNNGSFDNTTEQIFLRTGFVASSGNYTVTGSFLVPSTATANTILRLRVIDDLNSVPSACHNPTYGQAEDYPVYLSSPVVLPVSLLQFTGEVQNETAVLKWKTAQEDELKNFEIEKSADGVEFTRIGVVNTVRNGQTNNYIFTDLYLDETNYYRLRLRNFDGSTTVSKIILIKTENSGSRVSVTTNPFVSTIELQVSSSIQRAKLQLLNAAGSLVAETTIMNPAARIQWKVPGNLSKGIYFLRTITDKEVTTHKLVKE